MISKHIEINKEMTTCQCEFLMNKTSWLNLISLSDGWDFVDREEAADATYFNVTEAPDIVPHDTHECRNALAEVRTKIWLESTLRVVSKGSLWNLKDKLNG